MTDFYFHDVTLVERIKRLLETYNFKFQQLHPLKGDASSRHYIRVKNEQQSAIVMTSCPRDVGQRFLKIQILLDELGLRVPKILAFEENSNVEDPLMILEDLGNQSFGKLVDHCHGQDRIRYYHLALNVLNHLHQRFESTTPTPIIYDGSLWLDQLRLLPEIISIDQVGTKAFTQIWQELLKDLDHQPTTLILRDYHLDNIMYLSDQADIQACGLLDFQDAGLGHPLYDVISLLEEARRDLPQDERKNLLDAYQKISPFTFNEIWYHRLAMVRHCRVLAIFTKLSQEGKTHYSQYIPHLKGLLAYHLAYPDLKDLNQWFKHYIPNGQ